jgi:uncharacterized membrane-anchored protein YitT (DUF2179 family)
MEQHGINFKIKNFIMLFVAGIVNSVGVTLLLLPAGFYDSGISGVSMLINNLTPSWVQLWIPLVVLNLPIFLFAMKSQGLEFTLYSLFAIAIYSLLSSVFQNVIPYFKPDFFENGSPLAGGESIICAIFGGLLSGLGSGITIRFGGTMDGIETLAVMFAKKLNLTVGNFVLIFNVFLYLIIGIISYAGVIQSSQTHDFTPALYSIVAYFAASKAVDFVSDGLDQAKGALIITSRYDSVCKALSYEFGRGLTIMDAVGYYSKTEKQVIYCVINRFQVSKLRDVIVKEDKDAFVTLMDITDVIGTSIKYSRANDRSTKKHKQNNAENAESSAQPTENTTYETAESKRDNMRGR